MPIPENNPATTMATPAAGESLSDLIRDADPGRTGTVNALPISPNFPFFLMHWPTNWQVEEDGFDGPTWLPYLSPHIILPGCNLNRTIRKGEPATAAYDQAVLRNVRRGATYLDVERHRTPDGGKYLREAPCRDPRSGREGVYYLDAFTTPKDAIPGRRLRFHFNRAASNGWRLHLVQSGILSPPPLQILEEIIGRKQRKVGRVRGNMKDISQEEYDRRVDAAVDVAAVYMGATIPIATSNARAEKLTSPGSVPDADAAEVA